MRDRERGAALVEFALVLPLLLVVIAGIVDFGFALQRLEVVNNAAIQGARLGTKPTYGSAAIKQRVRDYIQQALNVQSASALDTLVPVGSITVTSPTVDVALSGGGNLTLTTSRVDVFYHHQFMLLGPIMGLINHTWGQSISLKATSVMTVE